MTQLPPGWEWSTVGEITVPTGKIDPREAPSHMFTYIDIGGIDNERGVVAEAKLLRGDEAPSRARQQVHSGDVILSTVRTYMRKTAIVPPSLDGQVASTGFSVLRTADGVLPELLLHFARTDRFVDELSVRQTGSSYPAVRDRDVRSMEVPVPPRSEQERIVAALEEHLSRLDAAEASLHSAFARLPTLRDRLVKSAFESLGPIKELHEVADVVSGQTPKGLAAADTGAVPFFKVGDMNSTVDGVLRDSRTMLSEQSVAELKLRVRPKGTIVFPKRGGAIATNKKRVLGRPGAFDLNTMGVITGAELGSEFLRWWFETVDLSTLSDGSNVPQINHGDIAPLQLPVPSLEIQDRVAARLDSQCGSIDHLRADVDDALRRATALRQSILAAAFSGKLVPQDPTDEPASVLLERIRAERATTKPTRRPKAKT